MATDNKENNKKEKPLEIGKEYKSRFNLWIVGILIIILIVYIMVRYFLGLPWLVLIKGESARPLAIAAIIFFPLIILFFVWEHFMDR